jgi:hypothetical protein
LIKVDIIVLAGFARGILREEESEPLEWRGLRGPSITIFHAGEVICNQNPAGFTIEILIVLSPICGMSRGLPRKGEINGQSLVRDSSSSD